MTDLMKPIRVQLKRTKGWRMPENTVKVDRTTVFGNPFQVSDTLTAKDAVRMFKRFWKMPMSRIAAACKDGAGNTDPMGGLTMIVVRNVMKKRLHELRGKNLACWCKPGEPCHADVLLELANREPS